MIAVSPNRYAPENIRNGRQAFTNGLKSAEGVLLHHLKWNRGAAAEYHFANGYRDAAKEASTPIPLINEALRLVEPMYSGDWEKNRAIATEIAHNFYTSSRRTV